MAVTVVGPPVDVSCLVQSFDSGPVVVPMAEVEVVMEGHTP